MEFFVFCKNTLTKSIKNVIIFGFFKYFWEMPLILGRSIVDFREKNIILVRVHKGRLDFKKWVFSECVYSYWDIGKHSNVFVYVSPILLS